jgi:hypothetical protein
MQLTPKRFFDFCSHVPLLHAIAMKPGDVSEAQVRQMIRTFSDATTEQPETTWQRLVGAASDRAAGGGQLALRDEPAAAAVAQLPLQRCAAHKPGDHPRLHRCVGKRPQAEWIGVEPAMR